MNGKKAKLIRKAIRAERQKIKPGYMQGPNGQIINPEMMDYRDTKRRVQGMKG